MMEAAEDGAPAMEMPRYKSHKMVWALKISAIEINADKSAKIAPADKGYAVFETKPGWAQRFDSTKDDPGYYVVYDDGFASWSPTKAFDDGYARESASYKDRVIAEEMELSAKLKKLGEFIHGYLFASLDLRDKELLQEQDDHMRAYVTVLRKRIERFGT